MKTMWILLISISLVFSYSSQEKETVYLFFDIKSNNAIKVDLETTKKTKYYKNKDTFHIEGQPFKIKTEIGLIMSKEQSNITYVSIDYLRKKWKESQLFSSLNVFKKIYIVEKIKGKFYLYEVTWNSNLR